MRVVLVVDGDVVEAVFTILIHPLQTVLHDDRDLVRVSRIVYLTSRHNAEQDRAVTILMLQTFAQQSRSPRSSANQESLAPRISKSPHQVADTLIPEHRVIDVERNHGHAIVGVAGSGRREAGHGTRLGDSLFKNLSVFGFLVV